MAANPYIGDIVAFGFNFSPPGWQACDGSLLSINEYGALFTLIGTAYGGDGVNNFAVPDLRGRSLVGIGNGRAGNVVLGETDGSEQVTIDIKQMPMHSHALNASSALGVTSSPARHTFAITDNILAYGTPGGSPVNSAPDTLVYCNGGSTPVDVRDPYLGMNWCIAVAGILPSLP